METDTSGTSETETSSLKTLNIDDVSMCGSVVTVETLDDDDDDDDYDDKNDDVDTDTQTEAEDSSAGVAAVTESVGSIIAAVSAPDPRCDNSDTDL